MKNIYLWMYLISDLTKDELLDEVLREDLVEKNSFEFLKICKKIEKIVKVLCPIKKNICPSDEENVWEWYDIRTRSEIEINISHAKYPLEESSNPIKIIIYNATENDSEFISNFQNLLSKEFSTEIFKAMKNEIP